MRNVLVQAIMCLLIIISCASDSDRLHQNRIQLVYWSANNQYEINLAELVVREWNDLHPTLQVSHQPIPEGRSSEEVVLSAIVGKKTPDVYSNMWPGDAALYTRANALLELDQFSDFDSVVTARFDAEKLAEARSSDGHVHQILWKTNPIMMIYNVKMLREAGFNEPPETYQEFLELGKKIARDLDGDGYIDRWVGITQILVTWWQRFFDYYTLYIAATQGRTFLKDGDVDFENDYSVEVFRFLQTLFNQNYFPRERMDARADVFLHSIVATRFTGPWEITHADKLKPEGFEYDFAPVPRPNAEGPAYTYGDYKSIIIFKNTEHPEESWQFVKFLISKQNDLRLLELTNQLPLRKDLLSDSLFQDYFAANPLMVKFARQAERVRGVDHSPVLREIFEAISQEFEMCVIYGKKSPEQAVKDAAQRVRLVME